MKITDAWVDDPLFEGEIAHPRLCVEVSEKPDVSIQPEPFGHWTVGKYGPFVKYSASDKVDAGDFNVNFRNKFQPVVDVSLFLTDHDRPFAEDFSMHLSRARQLVKKYDPSWRLLLSDKEAQNGRIIWRPVQTQPRCRWHNKENPVAACTNDAVNTATVKGVEVPYCDTHMREHNAQFARIRTKAS